MASLLLDTHLVLWRLQGFRWLPLTNWHLLAVAELETHPHRCAEDFVFEGQGTAKVLPNK